MGVGCAEVDVEVELVPGGGAGVVVEDVVPGGGLGETVGDVVAVPVACVVPIPA